MARMRPGSSTPNTSLVQVVLNPLEKWKTSLEVFGKARSFGMEVVVALDTRSGPGSYEAVKEHADIVIPFDNQTCWPEGGLNQVLEEAHRDWAFLVSDDEEPSPQLWDFATKIPSLTNGGDPFIWRCRMLAPLPDWSALYKPLDTYQPRYFPRDGLRWGLGFDELPKSPFREIDFDLVLWHYTLWSPRTYREQKVKDHEEAWRRWWYLHPWEPSSRKAYLYEDFPEEFVPLGGWEKQRSTSSCPRDSTSLVTTGATGGAGSR